MAGRNFLSVSPFTLVLIMNSLWKGNMPFYIHVYVVSFQMFSLLACVARATQATCLCAPLLANLL